MHETAPKLPTPEKAGYESVPPSYFHLETLVPLNWLYIKL